MKYRSLLARLLSVVLVLASLRLPSSARAGSLASVRAGQPNIIFVLLDDQDFLTSPFWEAMPETKRLVKDKGLSFNQAFAPTPICCPARSTILTGLLGHNTGVLTNGGDYGGWKAFINPLDAEGRPTGVNNEERTIGTYLKAAGYRTGHMGKYLNGIEEEPEHVPPGWSEYMGGTTNTIYLGYGYKLNEYIEGESHKQVAYGFADSDYMTDVLAKKAQEFLVRTERNDDQPFFLMLTPTAPHLPLQPARRHKAIAQKWVGKLPHRGNYGEGDLSDKPSWLRLSGPKRAAAQGFADAEYADRMGSLLAVDEMIAAMFKTLEKQGELANTIFILGSDNGYNLGSHRLIHKMAPYEESIRVPFVVVGPGIRTGTTEVMTLESDIMPTILDLASVPIPSHVDGKSVKPFLASEAGAAAFRSDFIIQYNGGAAANGVQTEIPSYLYAVVPPGFALDIPTYKAVRNKTHKYVEWYENDRHEEELYEIRPGTDPLELDNLLATEAGRNANAAILQSMRNRLEELRVCKGAACR